MYLFRGGWVASGGHQHQNRPSEGRGIRNDQQQKMKRLPIGRFYLCDRLSIDRSACRTETDDDHDDCDYDDGQGQKTRTTKSQWNARSLSLFLIVTINIPQTVRCQCVLLLQQQNNSNAMACDAMREPGHSHQTTTVTNIKQPAQQQDAPIRPERHFIQTYKYLSFSHN